MELTFLNEEQLSLVKMLKGKKIRTITAADWSINHQTIGNIMINADQLILEIGTDYYMHHFLGENDEAIRFNINKLSRIEEFEEVVSPVNIRTEPINSEVKSIKVVRDKVIIISTFDQHTMQTLEIDQGFVFQLNNGKQLTLAIDNEVIPLTDIYIDEQGLNHFQNISKVADYWTDNEEHKFVAKVSRSVIEL